MASLLTKHFRIRPGQSIVEVLLVMGLSAIILPALLTAVLTSRQGKSQHMQRSQALMVLQETSEAVRSIRSRGWDNISTSGTYHPVVTGDIWTLSAGADTVSGFSRSVSLTDVFRNETGQIVASGGLLDSSSKLVTVTASWNTPSVSNVSAQFYLTRSLDNLAFSQTSTTDFSSGTLQNVAVTNDSGGEVKLAQNTKGRWCDPHLSPITIDLPGGPPIALSAVEGHIYVASGNNTLSTTDSFIHVEVGNSDTPSFSIHGKLRGYQTNAVFGEPNWGYIATTNNLKEIVIVNLNQYDDVAQKLYHEEGYFNTPSNTTDANTIFVMGNRGYLTAGNYLYVFDLTAKNGSRNQIGNRIQFANSGDIAGEIYGRIIDGQTYIFIAIKGSTVEEMKIANVTNNNVSSQWRIVGGINIEPNNCSSLESGQAVYVKQDGTRAYISSVNDTTFKEFFVIDTSNKTSPTLVGGFATRPPCTNGGGYEAGGMNPEQSVVVSLAEDRAVLVGTDATGDAIDSEEYQVLDLTDEAHPARCGGMQFNQGIFGVAGVKESDGDAFTYLITGDAGNELKIVQGGPDGNYNDGGVYTSAVLDAGSEVAFNRFEVQTVTPPQTSIRFQVAITDPVSGSCDGAVYNFVGPDKTSATYFTTSDQIPLDDDGTGYENPSRCLKFKAFLTTLDYNVTPVFSDIYLNYSP